MAEGFLSEKYLEKYHSYTPHINLKKFSNDDDVTFELIIGGLFVEDISKHSGA